MAAPSVYTAINAIAAELAQHGIAKSRTYEADDYKYRSIDDVLDRLAPLLAKHRPRASKNRSGTFWIMSPAISPARPTAWKLRRHSSSMPTARG